MIEYFAMALGFYIGLLVYQFRSREGLYVHDLFLFAGIALMWPVAVLFGLLS